MEVEAMTHDTNCKNCGGSRDLYSCHYCGTVLLCPPNAGYYSTKNVVATFLRFIQEKEALNNKYKILEYINNNRRCLYGINSGWRN